MSDASSGLIVRTLSDVQSLAEILWKSNLFPNVASVPQAVVKIILGAELGFGPLASMNGIHIFEGRAEPSAHLQAALIKRSDKYDYAILEHSDIVCAVEFYECDGTGKDMRKGKKGWRLIGTIRYTIEQANEKGWTRTRGGKDKSPWLVKPANMLFANVLKDGYRFYTPDLSSGAGLPSEDFEAAPEQQPAAPEVKAVEPMVQPSVQKNGETTNPSPAVKEESTATAPAETVVDQDNNLLVIPHTGTELLAALDNLEKPLVKTGECTQGSLVRRVQQSGNDRGFHGLVSDWQGPALEFAMQEAAAAVLWFTKARIVTRIDDQLQRLKLTAQKLTVRTREVYGTDDLFALTVEQLGEVLQRLKKAPTPKPASVPA